MTLTTNLIEDSETEDELTVSAETETETDTDAIFQVAEALLIGGDSQPLWPFNLPIDVN